MSLQGDVSELGIGELLQTITLNNHEGTLKIHSEKEGDRYFYLSKGEIQLVSPGKKGLRLGEALIKQRKITQEQLDRALVEQQGRQVPLGQALVDLGFAVEEDLEAAITQQFREEFFEIFLLTKGAFEFYFRTRPDQLVQFDETTSRVSMNTSGLMLEALRQIDEWQVMSKSISTPRAVFTVDSQEALDQALAEIAADESVKQAVPLIDGKNTIADIVEKTPATKFDVYALLHQLVEAKAIRPLMHGECSDAAAAAEASGDTFAATVYYEYGAFLEPRDVELRERQFKLLKRLKVYKEAKEAALAVAERRLAAKECEEALAYYLEAQACDEKDIRAAEGAFRARQLLGKSVDDTSRAGDALVKLALRQHEMERARKALEALLELEPDAHRRRVQLAELMDDDPEGRERAIELYSEAVNGLTRPEDAKLRAEASRKLLALDSRRADAQAALKESVAQEEQIERRRTIKLVLAIAGTVLLMVGAYAVTYGMGASRALAEAEHEAQQAGDDQARLAAAADAFRYVARAYPLAPAAARAEQEAGKLRDRLKALSEQAKQRAAEQVRQQAASAEETRRKSALDLLTHAEAAERRGDWREAAQAKLDLLRDYSDIELDRKVLLPIPVATEPPGARVLAGGRAAGASPAVVYAEPFKEVRVRVEMPGFLARDFTFAADKFEEVRVVLERTAVWRVKTDGPVEAAPAAAGARVFAASRDGQVYALGAEDGAIAWKLKIGEYGDNVSPPGFASGKLLVASSDGTLFALDPATGKAAWTFAASGGIRGEVRASADGLLLGVPASSGEVHFVSAAGGREVFSIRAERRVDGAVAFAPGRAYFGARDGKVHAVDLEKRAVAWTFEGSDAFLAGPLVVDDLVVAGGRDGVVYGLNATDGRKRWQLATGGRIRGAPVRAGRWIVAGSEDGSLHAIDPAEGSAVWRFVADGPIVAPAAVSAGRIYAVSSYGTLYRIDPEKGVSDWKFPLDASVAGAPAVAEGRIYVGSSDGSVRAILE